MTQEDKELLLKDLCARLPYNCSVTIAEGGIDGLHWNNDTLNLHLLYQIEEEDGWKYIKPYLRLMSSMTYEERKECNKLRLAGGMAINVADYTDWLNTHHFDYRGLIEKGLAIEAPEEIYK